MTDEDTSPALLHAEGQLLLMRRADGAGCSWGGVSYGPNDQGRVAVPFEAAADLQAMGFVAVGQIEAAAAGANPEG